MTAHFARAPHQGRSTTTHAGTAPNAALLIDFDNVTMGIRSDLSKELKTLLNSDVIKGKVAVQRAYADWRRYPQYIVPLSEASVDLIFAPAYGSSKKNSTDIRLAIDGLELVFTRPEIGTYILLSGDSDFSSLVLKLKEYGKYVIGVGMKESRSDILVQNCDEYYSYSALTGLTRAGEDDSPPSEDPWELVERAVTKMASRNDVMRSDRLKQVMLELDSSFDEKGLGYSKFNKFISEAASRDRIRLQKLDNGQYEVAPNSGAAAGGGGGSKSSGGRGSSGRSSRSSGGRDGSGRSSRRRGGRRGGRDRTDDSDRDTQDMAPAYELLRRAVADLIAKGDDAARDSDIKRRMLEVQPDWDERDFGLSKFSHFLRKAHNAEVINLRKGGNGIYEAVLPDTADASASSAARDGGGDDGADGGADRGRSDEESGRGNGGRRRSAPGVGALRGRRGPGRGSRDEAKSPPPLLEGQAVATDDVGSSDEETSGSATGSEATAGSSDDGKAFAVDLGLPTSRGALVRYVVNSYKGVGKKTAEALIDAFGAENVFATLERRPGRVRGVLGDGRRTSALLDAWSADRERRSGDDEADASGDDGPEHSRAERSDAGGGSTGEDATPAAPAANAGDAVDRADTEPDRSASEGDDSTDDEDEEAAAERRRRTRLGRRRGSRGGRRKTPAGGG